MIDKCEEAIQFVFDMCTDIDKIDDFPEPCNVINSLKKNNIDAREIWINDIINFCSFLSLADGSLEDIELDLINHLIGSNFNKMDIRRIVSGISRDWLELPLSLHMAVEFDFLKMVIDTINDEDYNGNSAFSEAVIFAFVVLGKTMISIDNDFSDAEIFENLCEEWARNMSSLMDIKINMIK